MAKRKLPGNEETRERILAASLQAFSRNGFDGTSIKEIAQEAEVAPGLLYHYFESKEDLLYRTIERYAFVPELCCAADQPKNMKVEDALLAAAKGVHRVFRQNEALLRVFFSQAVTNPSVNKRWLDVLRHGVEHLELLIRAHIDSGELREHDAQVVARTILHASSAFAITGVPESALETVVAVILDGVRAEKQPSSSKHAPRRSKK